MAEQLFPVSENYPEFRWDPALGLCPPDMLSVLHTRELAQDIRLRRYVHQDTEEPIRVAIAGDTGLYAIALMKQLLEAQEPYADGPLHLEVFDINPHAVATAERNIAAYERYMSGFSAHVFEADWNDDALWQYFQQNPVHFLISNPPYLPTDYVDELIESSKQAGFHAAYAMTSPVALDGGSDGLDHMRTLLQRAPEALAEEGPTGVFLRYSFHTDSDVLRHVIDKSFGVAANSSFNSFQGVGPSSLGQEGMMRLTGGDTRILETAVVRMNSVKDVVGSAEILHPHAEMSLRHAAALGGMVMSADQCKELLMLRKDAGLSFAEEEVLAGGLQYLAVRMGRRHGQPARNVYELPSWELRDLWATLGRGRVRELYDAAAAMASRQ